MKDFIIQNSSVANQDITVAIDNGYDSTKVYAVINGKEYKFKFRSKYELSEDDLNKNNTMSLTWDNKSYLVGEGAMMDDLEYDKTNGELHKICTYTALARLSNFMGVNFNLVVGYPLNIYSKNKEGFAEYLKTEGLIDVKIRYDGNIYEDKLFGVNECLVLPQGAGAVFGENKKWEDKIVAILDIGGQTINGCIMNNLNIVRQSIFTEKLGVFILENEIKKNLDSAFGVDIQPYEMQEIMKNKIYKKFGKKVEESIEIIEKTIQNHVKNIQKSMRLNKYNIEGLSNVLLVGGGSIVLKDYLCKVIPQCVPCDDPVFANVQGFYEVGKVIYGQKDI
jgi:plasmid segregation protein ParM